MESFGALPDYKTLYEPLHPTFFPEARRLSHGARLSCTDAQLVTNGTDRYLERVLRAQVVSQRPKFRLTNTNVRKRLNATKLAVKTVRANRVLEWIGREFDLRGVVFIVRHPCAVIGSWLRTGITGYVLPAFTYPNREHIRQEIQGLSGIIDASEICHRLEGYLEQPEGCLAASWALDHYVPLVARPLPSNVSIISYELAVDDCRGVGRFLGKKIALSRNEIATLQQALCNSPGSLTRMGRNKSALLTGSQKTDWEAQLTPEQIALIRNALEVFDIQFDDRCYRIGNWHFPQNAMQEK